MNVREKLWALSFLCFVIYAWAATSIGPVLPRLSEDYSLSSSVAGFIAGLYSVGGLFAFLGGRVSDRFDKAVVVSLFLILFSASSISAALSVDAWSFGFSLLLMGIFAGFLEAVLNPMISNLYPARRGFSTVIFHAAWNLGSALGPTFASLAIVTFGNWRLAYLAPALSLAFPSALLAVLGRCVSSGVERSRGERRAESISRRLPLMVSTLTLFYVAAEMGLSNWLASILESMGSGLLEAGIANGLYWGIMGTGRVFWAFFTDRLGYSKTLSISSFASLASITMASIPLPLIAKAAFWTITGFFFAPIFPTAMAWIAFLSPSSSSLYSGLAFANGALGAFLATWSAGIVADIFGVGASQFIFLVFTASMSLDVVLITRVSQAKLVSQEKV